MKNNDKVKLGPFVGVVDVIDDNRVWLDIYYEDENSKPISHKRIYKHETPYQALESWLKVDSILDSMHFHKLIKDFSIYY